MQNPNIKEVSDILDSLHREFIYLWYYFDIQLRQIFWYWVLGMVIGSAVSVFARERIHQMFSAMNGKKWGILGVIPAGLLGILSPLCMYGTIPIAASFAKKGMREDWLAAFMMSSILLNPQLLVYTAALGTTAMIVRLVSCILCGFAAGVLVFVFFKQEKFFDFRNFEERQSHDTDPNLFLRLLKNIGRNMKATGGYFLFGILLSAVFQRYVPADAFAHLFGPENEGFGVLMAATIGVPLYACGGGTIPLLQAWLTDGMSMGSAASFMITGPATKITNLGALKIALGMRNFIFYILYAILVSMLFGLVINLIL